MPIYTVAEYRVKASGIEKVKHAIEEYHGTAGGHVRNKQELPDYVVETTFHRIGHSSTKVEISHYYSTRTLKAKLLNLIARRKIARETQATLNASKAAIEERGAEIKNG